MYVLFRFKFFMQIKQFFQNENVRILCLENACQFCAHRDEKYDVLSASRQCYMLQGSKSAKFSIANYQSLVHT